MNETIVKLLTKTIIPLFPEISKVSVVINERGYYVRGGQLDIINVFYALKKNNVSGVRKLEIEHETRKMIDFLGLPSVEGLFNVHFYYLGEVV